MAHKTRRIQAELLAAQLEQLGFCDVSITWDRANSEWETGRRALSVGIDKQGWHLVLQDDAVLTPDFKANLEACIEALPTRSLVSLYVGKVRPMPTRVEEAVKKATQGSWLRFYMLLWGVAVLIPCEQIEDMLEYIGGERYDETLYDSRIGIYYQRSRMPIYYTMPSLVDHADELGSLLGHGDDPQPRVAHKLASGLLQWGNGVVDI